MDLQGLINRHGAGTLLPMLLAMGLPLLLTHCSKEPAAAVATVASATTVAPGQVRLYFDEDSAAPASDASVQLNDIVAYAKAHQGSRVIVSGYSDPRAAAPANEEMARNRALAIRNVLVGRGVDEMQVDQTIGGSGERGARVEVTVR
jgi:outer membrane protein OmpA-like peptidoglycan-associated protein